MTARQRPAPAVRRLGEGVSYQDGAEGTLLEVMRAAADLSSDSDELEEHIVDWPTRYHLSHQRSNLLRPLQIRPGTRILDVGAGTGATARYLGERGASVLALEGNMARAEVAAARVHDLPDVEVVCGTIDDLPEAERFDLVLVIGVLEYAASEIGGSKGPGHLLASVRRHLSPQGSMVLAIENQIGLKYLMGGAEDHLGEPWVGLEDYPGGPGPRTWTRRELGRMLAERGLTRQRWLAPFPDYKLPTVVLHEQLYEEPDADNLIEQLILRPVSFIDRLPARLGDAAAAHGVFVRAGLGLEVASSYLVVASPPDGDPATVVDDGTLAWIYGAPRRSRWRRRRRLTVTRNLVNDGSTESRRELWLIQDPSGERPFEPGHTLGQQMIGALRDHDLQSMHALLLRWWKELEGRGELAEAGWEAEAVHPFTMPGERTVIASGHLDFGPSNFVDSDAGLVYIDDEWRVDGPVDLDLVALRALFLLAHEVVTSGVNHPFGVDATVREVLDTVVSGLPLDVTEELWERYVAAEIQLQALVAGTDAALLRSAWFDPATNGLPGRPDVLLRRELDELRGRIPGLEDTLESTREDLLATAAERDHLRTVVAQHEAEIAHLSTVRGFSRSKLSTIGPFRAIVERVRDRGATR